MLNEKAYALGANRSCIRDLFEYGCQRAAIVGRENVYDYSLGNPSIPSPPEVNETIRPDFVVNLGDLIQDYGDYDEDVATLKDFWVKFRGFEVPVFTCVGNHDLRTTKDRAAVAAALEYERTTYSVDVAGIHLVVLGTDVDYNAVDERGTKYEKHWISQSDLDWLAEDLAETELPVIVCLHFGVAEDLQEGNYWFGS